MIYIPKLARGEILRSGGVTEYRGNIPFDDGEKVVMMDAGAFDLMLRRDVGTLLSNALPMLPEDSFGDVAQTEDMRVPLPDEVIYHDNNLGPRKLFLDERFFSLNPRDWLLARWRSADLAIEEEGIGEPEGAV